MSIKVFIMSTVQSVYLYLFYHTTISSKSFIAHFQKDCRPGASMGEGSLMGSFGGTRTFVFNLVRPKRSHN